MEALAGLLARVANNERRIDANHDSVSLLRTETAGIGTKVAVLAQTADDIGNDLHEMKESFEKQIDRVQKVNEKENKALKQELTWVKRGLWAGAGTFLSLTVTLAGVIIAIVNHG